MHLIIKLCSLYIYSLVFLGHNENTKCLSVCYFACLLSLFVFLFFVCLFVFVVVVAFYSNFKANSTTHIINKIETRLKHHTFSCLRFSCLNLFSRFSETEPKNSWLTTRLKCKKILVIYIMLCFSFRIKRLQIISSN